MPKKVSKFYLTEQPINWRRGFLAGAMSSAFMMAFIDIFYMMGITPFSIELYVGSLFLYGQYTPYCWMLGFFSNLIIGGIFGFLYAYAFEYVTYKSNTRLGILMGFCHAAVAALAIFPFFNAIQQFLGVNLYQPFGILGSALGAPTFILLLTGHLLFGASMGLFYGNVRYARVLDRYYEPGFSGRPGDPDVITSDEDNRERVAV